MPRPFLHSYPQPGFSLLEMSVVLMIVALVTAGTFSMGSSMIESVRKVNTNNKLDAIEEALMAFRLANNRLPCPSDATLTDAPANAATYGYEANNASGTCTGGSPAANYSYTLPAPPSNTNIPGGTVVAEGAVPVRTLGLPDEFQFDGWGRKFAYAVWTPLTATNAFVSYGVSPSCGAITVENAGHGYRTTAGAYALISYGSDGHGGYLQSGRRYFVGSDNADEWTNCHCNASADTGNYAATYVEQDATQTNPNDSYSVFDDIVRFKDRWQMQNAYDGYEPVGIPCRPGFRVDGKSGALSGMSVAVGDVNGDGIPDLIIGAPYANSQAGKVYVVFGTRSGFPDPLPLSSLNGTNGFELDGAANGNQAAWSVAVGDINGDGIQDIVIGAPYASPGGKSNAGSVYVVFGGKTGADNDAGTSWTSCPCRLDASFLNGTSGVEFDGASSSPYPYLTGIAVATGDINGDGIADVIIDAPGASPNGVMWAGSTYVVFGGKAGADHGAGTAWTSCPCTLDASYLNGANGAEFDGVYSQYSERDALATGDVNGDGIADIILSRPMPNSGSGYVYVVFGKKAGWSGTATLLSSLNGNNGIEFDGSVSSGFGVGNSVTAGDINGDGISDIIIGSPWDGASYNGTVYVVFGGRTGADNNAGTAWTSCPCTLGSSFLNGTNGIQFDGMAANGYAGTSVAVGDINGDGVADLLIGGDGANSNAGAVYVVFGKTSGWPAVTSLNSMFLNGVNGVEFDGRATNGYAGVSVAAGDINGDGTTDLIIGAPGTANTPGSTYVYFGHKNTPADPWPTSGYDLGGL